MAVTELSSGSSSSLRAAASSSASSASSPVSTTRKSHLHSRSDNHLHTFFFIRHICKHLHSYLLRLIERVVSVHAANVSPETKGEKAVVRFPWNWGPTYVDSGPLASIPSQLSYGWTNIGFCWILLQQMVMLEGFVWCHGNSPGLPFQLLQLQVLMVDILYQRGRAWTAVEHICQQLAPCVVESSTTKEKTKKTERLRLVVKRVLYWEVTLTLSTLIGNKPT